MMDHGLSTTALRNKIYHTEVPKYIFLKGPLISFIHEIIIYETAEHQYVFPQKVNKTS